MSCLYLFLLPVLEYALRAVMQSLEQQSTHANSKSDPGMRSAHHLNDRVAPKHEMHL